MQAYRKDTFDMKDLARDCRFLRDQYGEAIPEVLISFIGDAYQRSENHLGKTRLAIKILTAAQIPFTILTKSNAIQRDFDILGDYRDKFRLGMTIITPFEDEAQAWEPGAPSISSRIDTLAEAKRIGIRTWVSLEPVMKLMSAVKLVKQFHHLVDFWAVGKLNHMEPPKPIDWVEAMREILAALESVGANYKFKRSFKDL
jgi:DNA repair photolyase